jgi:hypothetical protein
MRELINDIFRAYGPAYVERYGKTCPVNTDKVIAAMARCRTEDNGTPSISVMPAGRRNVSTPPAAIAIVRAVNSGKPQWLDKQRPRQLPGRHFMLTFTVPEPLLAPLRAHQRVGYGALYAASVDAIKTLAADPKFGTNAEVPAATYCRATICRIYTRHYLY